MLFLLLSATSIQSDYKLIWFGYTLLLVSLAELEQGWASETWHSDLGGNTTKDACVHMVDEQQAPWLPFLD